MTYVIVIMSLVAFNIIMIILSFIANKNWFNECIKRNEEWANYSNYCIKINQEWSNLFCKLNDSLEKRIKVLEKEVIELKRKEETEE